MNISSLVAANADRWTKVRVTGTGFVQVAKRLVAQKSRYVAVEKTTGVPWFIVAVIHEREASQRFDTQLGQGDPLNRVSTHVPKGRGPFSSWEQGAYDALVRCAPYASRWQDWSPGGALTLLEQYNGLGYAGKGRPSPYVWAGTNQYVSGKYVADGVYDATAVDKQLGCAGLIIAMQAMDPTIQFGPHAYPATHDATEHPAAPAKAPAAPVVTPAPAPVPTKPSLANTISIVLNAIRGLFKK
jgi:lysozyme family protein